MPADAVSMEITNVTTSAMEINPNREVPVTAPHSTEAKPSPRAEAATQPDFTAAHKLAQQLASTPDVRADEVARAKALIADPNYPDDKTIRAVARRLANASQRDVMRERLDTTVD